MEVSGDDPLRADCATPGAETVRLVEILSGTTEVNDCSDPATSGYAYDERNFIVCIEDLWLEFLVPRAAIGARLRT